MTTIVILADRNPAVVTHRALDELAARLAPEVTLQWLGTGSIRGTDLDDVGVWVGPGTPYADESAVLDVLRHRRETERPTLGTCGGFQHMVVEFARDVAGLEHAAHGETQPGAEQVVVASLACSLVGEVRAVSCVPGTRLAAICGTDAFPGYHYCSYGVADEHRGTIADAGLVLSAYAPDAGVEAVELPDHPFYVGTLFQPQMSSVDGGPVHPVVQAFVEAVRRSR
jgi:CTP synthase (UTP-ammonia lyase)